MISANANQKCLEYSVVTNLIQLSTEHFLITPVHSVIHIVVHSLKPEQVEMQEINTTGVGP